MKNLSLVFAIVLCLFSSLVFAKKNSGLAVVLIDMQYGFYERGGVTDTSELQDLVKNQQKLLSWAKKNNIPVIVFEYLHYGKTDTRLTEILREHQRLYISKRTDSGFRNKSAQAARNFLEHFEVDTLIVAGVNGPYCVRSTILDAVRSENYSIITSDDLVADINLNPPTYPFCDYKLQGYYPIIKYKTVEEIIR